MAQTLAVRGTKLLIQIGDGNVDPGPEQFVHPCLINTDRSFALNAEMTDFPTLDCDDLEAVAWAQREKVSLSGEISGAGRLHVASFAEYDTWLRSPDPKNVKVNVNAAAANGGGSWTGPFHLTQFQVTGGDKGTTIEASLTLVSSGVVGPFVPAT